MGVLTPERGLIFRVTHIKNVPWILEHGIHCRSSDRLDPNYVEIGNPDLIMKRTTRAVPIPPGGSLADYVPFYFTPCSPMLYNIKTGRDVRRRDAGELAFLVSALPRLRELGVPFVFTDRHAYLAAAGFFDRLEDVNRLDWVHLQRRDFKRSVEDPEKMERYQAEALIHREVPVAALSYIVCCRSEEEAILRAQVERAGLELVIRTKREWFFE